MYGKYDEKLKQDEESQNISLEFCWITIF